MTIQEKVKQLLELRDKINSIKKQLEPIQVERDSIQADIIQHMTRQGFNSVKTENATIAKAERKSLQILNEDAVLAHLKKKKLRDLFKVQIVKPLFKGYASEAIKSGVEIPGTAIGITEFISVKKVGGKKK